MQNAIDHAMKNEIKIALADDHILFRNGLASLVESFGGYKILFEADNGRHFIAQLGKSDLPDIVLMDINMPEMDGCETTLWLKKMYPEIKVLALSMYDNENAIIRMFRAGARGYILKDSEPGELRQGLRSMMTNGFYYSEMLAEGAISDGSQVAEITGRLKPVQHLSEEEKAFIKLTCSELSYQEIADNMALSIHVIDGYREALFERLGVKTRVGLVVYAIKNKIIDP